MGKTAGQRAFSVIVSSRLGVYMVADVCICTQGHDESAPPPQGKAGRFVCHRVLDQGNVVSLLLTSGPGMTNRPSRPGSNRGREGRRVVERVRRVVLWRCPAGSGRRRPRGRAGTGTRSGPRQGLGCGGMCSRMGRGCGVPVAHQGHWCSRAGLWRGGWGTVGMASLRA